MWWVAGRIALIIVVAVAVVLSSGLVVKEDEWQRIAGAHSFNILRWEYENLFDKWKHKVRCTLHRDCDVDSTYRELVDRYLQLEQDIMRMELEIERRKGEGLGTVSLEAELASLDAESSRLRPLVEEIIESQISSVLAGLGFSSTIRLGSRIDLVFPPVDIALSHRPNLLIVSLRERIELIDTVLLKPDISADDKISLEEEIDGTGFSGLVTRIGGVATYPSIVPRSASLERMLSTAVHEWFHHYLAFRPLGRNYWSSYEMRIINETVADIAGDEIGRLVYVQFYNGDNEKEPPAVPGDGFDFRKVMRAIRLAVDEHLASGEIEQAEQFMEERRLYLAENGYYIRKLNQAFFAFHGAYGDSPASVSPVGAMLQKLRDRSPDFGEFIKVVSAVSSYDDLLRVVSE